MSDKATVVANEFSMAKAIALLFGVLATSVFAGKGPIDPTCSTGVEFVSYHIHVLFW